MSTDLAVMSAADELVQDVVAALGPRLRAAYSFGVSFGRAPRTAGGRVLLLVDKLDEVAVDALGPLLAHATDVRARVDTPEHVLRGADAFPALALELIETRVLLAGTDVLADLHVDPATMRVHIEHGLRALHNDIVEMLLHRSPRQAPGAALMRLRRRLRRFALLLEGALIAAGRPITPASGAAPEIARILAGAAELAPLPEPAWSMITKALLGNVEAAEIRPLCLALLDVLPPVIDAVERGAGEAPREAATTSR